MNDARAVEEFNIRSSNIPGPYTDRSVIVSLDGDPCHTGSILAVLNSDILTLDTWDILIDSESQIVAIASHGLFACCSNLHVARIVGVDLRDFTTLCDGISSVQLKY